MPKWIISSEYQTRILSLINYIGGIIKFLNNKDDNSISNVVIINAKEILNPPFSKFTEWIFIIYVFKFKYIIIYSILINKFNCKNCYF